MKQALIIALMLVGYTIQAQTGSIYHDIGYPMPVHKKATHELPVWVGPSLIVVGAGISATGWWLMYHQFDFNNPVTIYRSFAVIAGGAALTIVGTVISKKVFDYRKREKQKLNRIY